MATPTEQTTEVNLSTSVDGMAISNGSRENEDDYELALKGMVLLLNNSWSDSYALFEKYKEQSAIMHFGYAFVGFMQSMMALEEEKMQASKKVFEELEKRCRGSKGILKKLKRKIKGDSESQVSQEDKWMLQIIVADSLLYQSLIVFFNQDLPSYIKGGWLMRKAWKIYEKSYSEINKYYQASKRSGKTDVDVDQSAEELEDDEPEPGKESKQKPKKKASQPKPADENSLITETISRDTLSRLLGAVSFGYGLFQLMLSLIPDKILKLIEFLGFHGDKEAGLTALEFSAQSSDMRSPLAVLSILWYHTIMKPFFTNEMSDEEIREIQTLIEKYSSTYPQSSLFLFFSGRLCRLQRDLDAALDCYKQAQEHAAGQKELINAALFETSWVNMMKLNYSISLQGFKTLLAESKWSKAFYTYIKAICEGALGNLDEATREINTVPGLVKKKTNQIEAFVSRRALQFKKMKLSSELCQLLALEMVYMWNGINQLSPADVEKSISVCTSVEEKQFFHLRSLLEAALLKLQGDADFSEQCFKEAIARHEGMKHDNHIAAHAMYELGAYYSTQPDRLADAKTYLLKARDSFKEYDFENRLSVKIRDRLKRIEASTK